MARSISKDAAIELVSADPEALNDALMKAKPMVASPIHRATGWGEVAATIAALSAMIPDD